MSQALTHSIESTPNNQILALRVQVRQDVLVSDPTIIPAEGVLYKDFKGRLFDKALLKNFGNYRFIDTDNGFTQRQNPKEKVMGMSDPVEGINGNATISLFFLPSMTDAQRNTPYRTLTYTGNHRWGPILKFLEIIPNAFPRSTNGFVNGQAAIISGPSYYVKQGYIPECNEGTKFIEESFFSDIPYQINQQETPVLQSVTYDVPGARGQFEECFHADITIPATQSVSWATFVGDNTSIAISGGQLGGQFFRKTNFTEWAPYVLTDQQKFSAGYSRTRITVIPPPIPRIVVR